MWSFIGKIIITEIFKPIIPPIKMLSSGLLSLLFLNMEDLTRIIFPPPYALDLLHLLLLLL